MDDYDDYGDYDDDYDEGYGEEYYDEGYYYYPDTVCPDVTLANVLRRWFRAIKGAWWRLRHDTDDIPF